MCHPAINKNWLAMWYKRDQTGHAVIAKIIHFVVDHFPISACNLVFYSILSFISSFPVNISTPNYISQLRFALTASWQHDSAA